MFIAYNRIFLSEKYTFLRDPGSLFSPILIFVSISLLVKGSKSQKSEQIFELRKPKNRFWCALCDVILQKFQTKS